MDIQSGLYRDWELDWLYQLIWGEMAARGRTASTALIITAKKMEVLKLRACKEQGDVGAYQIHKYLASVI